MKKTYLGVIKEMNLLQFWGRYLCYSRQSRSLNVPWLCVDLI